MPKAVVSTSTEKFDLTTLPGGWVELRKMTYGEVLQRRDRVSTMTSGSGGGRKNGKRQEAQINFHFSEIRQFEFSRAVMDHNLEDENGKKLDLASVKIIDTLDPKVGQEIEDLIDKMNNFEGEEDEPEKTFPGSGDSSDSPQPSGTK